eukprot:CAMPEP_0194375062 /NCGR_PEP_ID=MMETSP0174-20130528/23520_1 /TAXON_ID=216777 /ORGANISM="Proboscia alata, Strain PI-D3" /LENGTH=99 /DNA_ID=CAMNT_0039155009 /DNA_START=82 /DNA_END=382 /DNA_ORIENTATION=+
MSPINDYETLLTTTEGASETGKKKGLLWMVLVMAACLASYFAGSSAPSIGAAASASMLKGYYGPSCVIDFYQMDNILKKDIARGVKHLPFLFVEKHAWT